MADITLTRGQIQDWVNESVSTALSKFQPAEGKVTAGQDDPSPALSGPLEIYGVRIDGKPVKAELVDGKYHAAQADMKADGIGGMLDGLDNIKLPFLGLRLGPVGSAVLGVSAGTIATTVVDAFVPQVGEDGEKSPMNLVANLGLAAAAMTFGPKYVGRTAAMFASGTVLVALALRWTPLQEWITKAADWITEKAHGVSGAQGFAGRQTRMLRDWPAPPALNDGGRIIDAAPAFGQRMLGGSLANQ